MYRRLLVAASVAILAAGAAIAVSRDLSTYSVEEVRAAFAESGLTLDEPVTMAGWTGYAPIASTAGLYLFPEPGGRGPFYVLVARTDDLARAFFEELTRLGSGHGTLHLIEGNVAVVSDASLTPTGLSADQRRRIDAAMSRLASG